MGAAPLVCIGILARNEERGIGALIDDLAKQILLTNGDVPIRLIVVANGCSDRTAELARQGFLGSAFARPNLQTAVHELDRPGKSNAWNELVHAFMPASTEYLFVLDGDIRIPSPDTLSVVLEGLRRSTTAVVAVDRSVKDLELERPRTSAERLIKLATGTANDPRTAIAGAFYCVRCTVVRSVRMPIGLPGEDGFLRAMLLTSSFAHDEQIDRHLFVENAFHIFESVRGIRGVIDHNVRLAIGTAVNILLFQHLRELRREGRNLEHYIRMQNARDPNWVNGLVRERLRKSAFPLEPRFVTRRLRRLRPKRQEWSPRAWFVAILGTAFDTIVFLKATALMRKGAGAGYW